MDRIFNALGDPTRVVIVEELSERDGQSLFELCNRLTTTRGMSMSRQAVAKHIAVLREAGLVTVRVEGRTSVHRLDRSVVREAIDWLAIRSYESRDS